MWKAIVGVSWLAVGVVCGATAATFASGCVIKDGMGGEHYLFGRPPCLPPTIIGNDRPSEGEFFTMCERSKVNGPSSERNCWNGYKVRCVERESGQPLHPEHMKACLRRMDELAPLAEQEDARRRPVARQADPAQQAIWKSCLNDCWREHCASAPTAETRSNCADNCHRRCGSSLRVVP